MGAAEGGFPILRLSQGDIRAGTFAAVFELFGGRPPSGPQFLPALRRNPPLGGGIPAWQNPPIYKVLNCAILGKNGTPSPPPHSGGKCHFRAPAPHCVLRVHFKSRQRAHHTLGLHRALHAPDDVTCYACASLLHKHDTLLEGCIHITASLILLINLFFII